MDSGWNYEAHAGRLAAKFAKYCDEIECFLPLKGKVLLDVGAGGGDFLYQARRRGARVMGLDIDLCGVRFARDRYGIDIQPCLLEEWPPPDGGVDVVTMWEVLEHLNDPSATIATASRVLKAGGWLLLSTPCLDSLWDRFAFVMYDLSFGRIQYPLEYRYSWTHLQLFTSNQLVRMLSIHGFEIVFQDRRTEFTYELEEYFHRVHPGIIRKALAGLSAGLLHVFPIKNKMVVYARRA
ncbi:MAG: class I SAM-dependent methyltransferase [Bacteroidota bacterium]|nr:class I SAM-dependent methyltransferase [Bacteroidota bacterium]